MSETNERTDTGGSHVQGSRRWLIAGLVAAIVVVFAVVAFASHPSSPAPVVPLSDQQAATTWAQQNTQMWSWMQSHWDEMTLMHEHWGDVSWMRQNLPDYAWMEGHWNDMAWMHDHWSGMAWMHTRGMMGSPAGGMMGQSGG